MIKRPATNLLITAFASILLTALAAPTASACDHGYLAKELANGKKRGGLDADPSSVKIEFLSESENSWSKDTLGGTSYSQTYRFSGKDKAGKSISGTFDVESRECIPSGYELDK